MTSGKKRKRGYQNERQMVVRDGLLEDWRSPVNLDEKRGTRIGDFQHHYGKGRLEQDSVLSRKGKRR